MVSPPVCSILLTVDSALRATGRKQRIPLTGAVEFLNEGTAKCMPWKAPAGKCPDVIMEPVDPSERYAEVFNVRDGMLGQAPPAPEGKHGAKRGP